MPEILIKQNLPYVNFSDTHTITPLQVIAKSRGRNAGRYFLMADGSICKFFRLSNLDCKELARKVVQCAPGVSIQIFRLHRSEGTQFWVCIQASVDYSSLKMPWNTFLLEIFSGPQKKLAAIRKETRIAEAKIDACIPEFVGQEDYFDNDLMRYLRDPHSQIKSNIALIKASDQKYFSSCSINNLASLPAIENIIDRHEFLQVTTLIKPSKEHHRELSSTFIDRGTVIQSISDAKTDKARKFSQVHTMVIGELDEYLENIRSGTWFINSKLLVRTTTLSEMESRMLALEEELYAKEVLLYQHTMSGYFEYVSAFPGNGSYGEHYHTIARDALEPVLLRVLRI